jgi:allophanate hydrolase subunit 2
VQAAARRQELFLPSALPADPGPIRVVLGPDDHHFHPEALEVFLSSEYTVSQEADRIGLRLDGPTLTHSAAFEIPSQGTVNGTIQVPGSGKPIVLLADRQTTGGYTKIATVISADLPRVGQLQPGARIRFTAVDQGSAVRIARQQAETIAAKIRSIAPVRTLRLADSEELLAVNLVGGVVSALAPD